MAALEHVIRAPRPLTFRIQMQVIQEPMEELGGTLLMLIVILEVPNIVPGGYDLWATQYHAPSLRILRLQLLTLLH